MATVKTRPLVELHLDTAGGSAGDTAGGSDTPELHPVDIRDDVPKIRAIVEVAQRVLDNMSVY